MPPRPTLGKLNVKLVRGAGALSNSGTVAKGVLPAHKLEVLD